MLGLLAVATPAQAQDADEPDFYMMFVQCKVMASNLTMSDPDKDAIKIMPIEGHSIACVRKPKRRVSCLIKFEDGSKPSMFEGVIRAETSMLINLESDNSGDFFTIKPEAGAVVGITRIAGTDFLATKVCRGMYMTADEAKALDETRTKPSTAGNRKSSSQR